MPSELRASGKGRVKTQTFSNVPSIRETLKDLWRSRILQLLSTHLAESYRAEVVRTARQFSVKTRCVLCSGWSLRPRDRHGRIPCRDTRVFKRLPHCSFWEDALPPCTAERYGRAAPTCSKCSERSQWPSFSMRQSLARQLLRSANRKIGHCAQGLPITRCHYVS